MKKKLIQFKNIVKSYEDGKVVLKGIDLDIYENEFVTLLGPSGCGKTTLLRILGGFLQADQGEVLFDGQEISKLPPYKREVNTVFQKYALFPHMNVYDNIAFGLKLKKEPKDIIEQKVKRMLKLVNLEDYADRIETVMFPYNIVEDQGRDVLALAREKGIGTIAMKPLAGGNLDEWDLALRYIAASGVIDIMIPGMGSPEEVDRNASVNLAAPLTAEELSRCDAVRKELGTQFCRRCGYCAPCPNGIDIPSNFLMANYARKYGLAGWAEQRYKAMPYHAGSCVMCGACEKRCPYGLPIRDMLEGVAKVFGY